jgi:hypothetical protein
MGYWLDRERAYQKRMDEVAAWRREQARKHTGIKENPPTNIHWYNDFLKCLQEKRKHTIFTIDSGDILTHKTSGHPYIVKYIDFVGGIVVATRNNLIYKIDKSLLYMYNIRKVLPQPKEKRCSK